MQKPHLIFINLALASLFLLGCSGEGLNNKIFQMHGGETLHYSNIESEYVLVNYWASWCKPCVKEIPELNALNQHEQVAVFAYNFDRLNGDALKAEADKFKLNIPMVLNDPAVLFDEKSPSALPATLVLHPRTGAKKWLMGAQTKDGILEGLGLID